MLSGSLGTAACGGMLSADNICKDGCAKQADCTRASEAVLRQCDDTCNDPTRNGSDTVQEIKDKCRNATTVLGGIQHCVTSYCDSTAVSDCITAAVQKCDTK